jgi:hypothetical protein
VVTSIIPTPLFRIRSLMLLDMSSNQIQGEFPGSGFANLSKLVYLDMNHNGFGGSIPSQLFHLRHLQYLDMSSNSFHCIQSGEVGSLQNLTVLKLDENFLGGNIPKEMGNISKLQQLFLRGNNLVGRIPPSFLYLNELEELDLSLKLLRFFFFFFFFFWVLSLRVRVSLKQLINNHKNHSLTESILTIIYYVFHQRGALKRKGLHGDDVFGTPCMICAMVAKPLNRKFPPYNSLENNFTP